MIGSRASCPKATASSSACAADEAKAPPPTWMIRRSSAEASSGQLVDELPAERLPALDGETVEVALHREGHGTIGDGLQQPVHGGVT